MRPLTAETVDSETAVGHIVAMLRRLAAVPLLITLAACGSTVSPTDSTPSIRTPAATSSTPQPTVQPSADAAAPTCLLTTAQVSAVLDGTWSREAQPAAHGCVYTSSRGAIFATIDVGTGSAAGLNEARQACTSGVPAVKTGMTGFVCVEVRPLGRAVVGNFIARGRLWLALAEVRSGTSLQPQLTAMIALLNQLGY